MVKEMQPTSIFSPQYFKLMATKAILSHQVKLNTFILLIVHILFLLMVFEFGAIASTSSWDTISCFAAVITMAGNLRKHCLVSTSSKTVQYPLLPRFLLVTSLFSVVEAREMDLKVGRSGLWIILFIVLMTLGGNASGGNRGGRGSRGGRGRGGRGNDGRGNGGGRANNGGRGNGNGGDREEGGDGEGDEGNEGNGGNEEQQNQNILRISFERAPRSCSTGDYNRRPATEADRDTVHFVEGKYIKEPKKKKTLSYIIKMKWDENTHKTKGAEREAFYDVCLNEFKKYYAYPEGYNENVGDRAVRESVKKSWKSLPYQEKDRAEVNAEFARKAGSNLTRHAFRPHYFSQRTWDSLNEYWESDLFKERSIRAKKARAQLDILHHSGAMPFDERREILEAEKQQPLSDLEFMGHVYRFDDPAVKQLKEDMERIRASQSIESTPEDLTLDPPPSPGTLKKNHRRKEICLTIQARPVKKGKAFLHPRHPVAEVLGGYEAAKLNNTMSTQRSIIPSQQISSDSLDLVVRVSAEVHRMVRSLDMTEVPRAFLNEEMHRLATEAFPDQDDPRQQELWTAYMRLAIAFVVDAMALNQKVIQEGTRIEKAPMDRDINGNNDDEDSDAENYSLS